MVKKSDYETIFVGALNEHPVLIWLCFYFYMSK
jgi:hypothetical protein